MRCLFASDLHGRPSRYRALTAAILEDRPAVVLLGGDLLPFPIRHAGEDGPVVDDFVSGFMAVEVRELRRALGTGFPRLLLILGNDDPRTAEPSLEAGEAEGLWTHLHLRRVEVDGVLFMGYACVPPTPFQLKDWERYDVSRFVDPGSIPPEEGHLTVPIPADELRFGTIQADLERLVSDTPLDRAVMLLHSPPYRTTLDRAALDGQMVDHVPLDVHIGSIAIRRLIEERQPLATLHGHVHESTRLTGSWRDRLGSTHCFQAAHDGPELALVRFDTDDLEGAERLLL
jgi:Icc-related predicted phosphoesterase